MSAPHLVGAVGALHAQSRCRCQKGQSSDLYPL